MPYDLVVSDSSVSSSGVPEDYAYEHTALVAEFCLLAGYYFDHNSGMVEVSQAPGLID